MTRAIALSLLVVFCCYVLTNGDGLEEIRGLIRDAQKNVIGIENSIKVEANKFEKELNENSVQIKFDFLTFINGIKDEIKELANETGKDVENCIKNSNEQFINLENEASAGFDKCNDDDKTNIGKIMNDAIKSLPNLGTIGKELEDKYNKCEDASCKDSIVNSTNNEVNLALSSARAAEEQAHFKFMRILADPSCVSTVNKTGEKAAAVACENFKKCLETAVTKDPNNSDSSTANPGSTTTGSNPSVNNGYFVNKLLIILCFVVNYIYK